LDERDATWNPTSGCIKVSPGAELLATKVAERLRGVEGRYFEGGFDLTLRANMLGRPGEWKKLGCVLLHGEMDAVKPTLM
jgi:protein gp37